MRRTDPRDDDLHDHLPLTRHAEARSNERRIPAQAIAAAMRYGKVAIRPTVRVFTLGWRQVRNLWKQVHVDLSTWCGTVVVCGHDGAVVTVYRNARARTRRLPRFRESLPEE